MARRARKSLRILSTLAWLALFTAIGSVATFFLLKSLGGRITGARAERVRASSNWRDGRFWNLVPTRTMLPGSLWLTLKRQVTGKEVRQPPGPIPIFQLRKSDLATESASGLRATWIGHSTVLLEIGGMRVVTDPIWSERCSPVSWAGPRRFHPPPIELGELLPIDVAVISHDHYDHLDMASVQALSASGTKFMTALGVGAHLERWGVPASQITELDWGQQAQVGQLTFTSLPGRHFSGRRLVDEYHTQWATWSIRSPKHRVFFSGDTGFWGGLKDIGAQHGPFDLTLIKIGAYGETWPEIHVNPEEAFMVHQAVKGKVMLPVHWGTFNLAFHKWNEPPERLLARAAGQAAIVIPRPGQMVEPEYLPQQDFWWRGAVVGSR